MDSFELGKIYTDTITGFTGTATAIARYLHGNPAVELTPGVDKEGKFVDGRWFDVGRVRPATTS